MHVPASVRSGEKCSAEGGEHEEERASDVRQANEARRQRWSKLEAETAARLISFATFPQSSKAR